jgi:hypothetical protein
LFSGCGKMALDEDIFKASGASMFILKSLGFKSMLIISSYIDAAVVQQSSPFFFFICRWFTFILFSILAPAF